MCQKSVRPLYDRRKGLSNRTPLALARRPGYNGGQDPDTRPEQKRSGGRMTGYCMVLTTFESEAQADPVIGEILKEKLAACVQVMPIRSHYVCWCCARPARPCTKH